MPILTDKESDFLQYVSRNIIVEEPVIEFQFKDAVRPGWSNTSRSSVHRFNTSKSLIKRINIHCKEYPWAPFISLLQDYSAISNSSLVESIQTRESQREFVPGSSELKEISAILTLGNGLKRGIKSGGYLFEKHSHRNNPSGGRRFPLEVYIFANHIKELERGFYHYNIKKCGLEFIAGADDENQIQLLTNEESIGNSIFTVFMTAVGLRSIEKYGHLGYRLIFLEAGHLSQSFWLTATALGLRCWPMAGINESRFYKTLKINSHQEFFVFCLNFGR